MTKMRVVLACILDKIMFLKMFQSIYNIIYVLLQQLLINMESINCNQDKNQQQQYGDLLSFFTVIEQDTDLFVDPEYAKDVDERIKLFSSFVDRIDFQTTAWKIMNTLKKVYRIELKRAQDVECVKKYGVMEILIHRACEIQEITFTKQVVSLLVNYITANPVNQVEMMELVQKHSNIVSQAFEDNESLFYLEVFLYNSLCNQPEDFLKDFFSKQRIFKQVFTKVLIDIPQDSEEKYVAQIHEWFTRQLLWLLKTPYFSTVYLSLGDQKVEISDSQTKLLEYVRELIEEMSEDSEQKGTVKEIGENLALQEFLVKEVYQKLINGYQSQFLLEEFLRMMHNSQTTQEQDDAQVQLHENYLDSLTSLIQIFIMLSAMSADDQSSPLTRTLNSFGLLLFTMQLFQTLKTSQDTMKEVKNYQGDPKKQPTHESLLFIGVLSKLANLVTNLTYLQKDDTESVFLHTDMKYLGVILSHTRMDEHNPTMREWCLMIIRNMCQTSSGIRDILQNMKKADKNDLEVMEQIGVKQDYLDKAKKYE